MKIFGLEKLSLVDFPNLTAAVLFTGGCNFRCPFCHNAGLVSKEYKPLENAEIIDYLKKRKGLLDGVVVSGGEPTLELGLLDFLKSLKEMGYKVKLDTNGTSPTILQKAIGDGLVDYVAMDIKNALDYYPQTTGVSGLNVTNVKKSIAILLAGSVDYEFRTTLVDGLHTKERMAQMVKEIKGAKKLYLQHFVDNGGCITSGLSDISKSEAESFKKIFIDNNINCELRGY